MLDAYDNLKSADSDLQNEAGYLNPSLEEDLYFYLKGASDEIRFYANKPQSFLTLLTGAQLDLKLNNVKGAFRLNPEHPDQYLLDLDFSFKSDKFLKSGKVLLTLAFGLTGNSNIEIIDNDFIIKDVKLKKEQLYKIFDL